MKKLKIAIATALLIIVAGGALIWSQLPSVPQASPLAGPWLDHSAVAVVQIDDAPWSDFLHRHLRRRADGINRIAYGAVSTAEREDLEKWLRGMERLDVARLTRRQQLAYWINLYNAVTVDLVLQAYPVDSILKIKDGVLPTGPWNRKVVKIDAGYCRSTISSTASCGQSGATRASIMRSIAHRSAAPISSPSPSKPEISIAGSTPLQPSSSITPVHSPSSTGSCGRRRSTTGMLRISAERPAPSATRAFMRIRCSSSSLPAVPPPTFMITTGD